MEGATANLFDLTQDKSQELVQSIQACLTELGHGQLPITLYKQLRLGNQLHKDGVVSIEGMVKSQEEADKITGEIQKLLQSYGPRAFEAQIEVGISEGEKFPALNDLLVVNTKETKNFECATGEVVLVDFWATWCGPCQGPMQHNQEMVVKNEEKWAGKARIVGISLDKTVEDVVKRIEERKWDKIDHYFAPGGFRAPSAAQFGINGIPCVFLVDKKGTIRYRGHPSSVNLEDKINELIAEDENSSSTTATSTKTEETVAPKCSIHGCSDEHAAPEKKALMGVDAAAEAFKQFQDRHEANKHLAPTLNVVLVGNRGFKGKEETFQGRVILSGPVTPKEKENALEYWKNVIQPSLKDLDFVNRVELVDFPEAKPGSTCATCKKALEKGKPHYVCTACQFAGKEDHAFCLECADKELTQELNAPSELFHNHALLLLHEDCEAPLKTMARYMNEAMIIPETHPAFPQIKASKGVGGVACDGCGQGPVIGHRWACANCGNFDFCTTCYNASRDVNHENHAKVQEKGHDRNHLFYRGHYFMRILEAESKPFEFPETK